MSVLTEQQREELRIDLAIAAMQALLPTFGSEVELRRNVIAHKSFLMAEAMLRANDTRAWELPG